jgi:hypothetical protein
MRTRLPVRVDTTGSRLDVEGDAERWSQMQLLRRGRLPLEPWLEGLIGGALPPDADLLAALWAQLRRPAVERLLASGAGADAAPWLAAARQELPALVAQPAVVEAWLEPLLDHQAQCTPPQAGAWLEVLAAFQDPRVAQRLRRVVLEASRQAAEPGAKEADLLRLVPLLPLLGRQRQRQDAPLLLQCALDPGPLAWRRAALEGVALGLSAWPLPLLVPALQRLAEDLSPALAPQALDLLARLPQGQRHLRRLIARPLDPAVAERLQRRLQASPLVLVVHGRQGGVIPALYAELAEALSRRRGAPVLVQALTAEAPAAAAGFWLAAQRSGLVTLVPLLLLPGEHVRHDLPTLAATWRDAAAAALSDGLAPQVARRPFLGAWPAWQALVAQVVREAAGSRPHTWLHHPLQGALPQRFLGHLGQVFGQAGVPATEPGQPLPLALDRTTSALLVPYGLAPSRTAESLNMEGVVPPAWEVLPPLLELPSVRTFLLDRLEALP